MHDLSSAMGRICGAIVEMIKIGSHKKKIIKNNTHENIFMQNLMSRIFIHMYSELDAGNHKRISRNLEAIKINR